MRFVRREARVEGELSDLATRGLFWAWVANDLEELITMGPWSRRHGSELASELAGRLPVRAPRWVGGGLSEKHVRVSISVMGCLMLALAERGRATEGSSRLFQAGLLGFGIHGFTHLLNSAAWRGYTPGVATAPTVVIPFSAWAVRELARHGVLRLDGRTVATALVGLPITILGIHGLTARLVDPRDAPGDVASGSTAPGS
ncbi:HXXEE domain-containing protein [uncultured Propionibacterium sp.]|uniref:HXXEE domain-containing protein n=1 Tax=uncultured Propionibacterium sp. TaxID=218066 RepID=UPI002931844C|nr:HXXEE domain-containing protein [uncultured Propionibacterium sp.]